ncbi:hypothetical protein CAPTEDRAFT_225483 [Capitella teleta]|uniref:SUEL-type lectin domain-containing protein n=1 Tax=Capitella teleta TaxID=283909 RepID=R7UK73_CAPTE|nr:hypothetical protein CAPTEDRAFT_225483 [Capitella teleta]|eukprot:ELU03682.1 hypothetical protein CAPTEDRAFT_225483 [Capitella teleta]
MAELRHTLMLRNEWLNTIRSGKEFCQTESFKAKCAPGKVIVVQDAFYGRMRLNRCVKVDFGYIGCSSDVLAILDRKCSGKPECEIRIPDPDLDATQPCIGDLTRYLEASYLCISVHQSNPRSCQSGGRALVTSKSGYLLSGPETGTHTCPWLISAADGQRVNITLFEFDPKGTSWLPVNLPDGMNKPCRQYAIATDLSDQTDTSICSSGRRLSQAFLSKSSSVEIRIPSSTTLAPFLLKYDVVGCAKMELSDEYWVQYAWTSSAAQIGCTTNSNSWRLTCKDNEWVGERGNCTEQQGAVSSANPQPGIPIHTYRKNSASYLPKGFAVFLIVLIALIVGLCVVVFGLILSRRRKMKRKSTAKKRQSHVGQDYNGFADVKEDFPPPPPQDNIEFDIYRYPASHLHVQEPSNDYLYTLQRMPDHDVMAAKGDVTRVVPGTPLKKCTCRHGKTYDIPANLKTCVPAPAVCIPPPNQCSTYMEWEASSLLRSDHEPDVINVAKGDGDV